MTHTLDELKRAAFERAVWQAFCGLFITYEEALQAIENYQP